MLPPTHLHRCVPSQERGMGDTSAQRHWQRQDAGPPTAIPTHWLWMWPRICILTTSPKGFRRQRPPECTQGNLETGLGCLGKWVTRVLLPSPQQNRHLFYMNFASRAF